jgi:aminodeoxyfutalosine synthase
LEEKIFHMAGATTPQQQSVASLEHAIRETGRDPVQRDSFYRHLFVSTGNGSKPGSAADAAELACA